MATATTDRFLQTVESDALPFSLIEQKGLTARLYEEVSRATAEFARDPRGFLRELFYDEKKDTRRRRMIYGLLAAALVAHVALVAAIAGLGWRTVAEPKPEQPEYKITYLSPDSGIPAINRAGKPEPPGGNGGNSGGGGQEAPTPPSHGETPQTLPQPAILPPNSPPKVQPSLPTPAYIEGPESAPPPPGAVIGVPTANIDAPPSPGQGTGGGLGTGSGPGIGSGDGRGVGTDKGGPGSGGYEPSGNGSGDPALLESAYNTAIRLPGFSRFEWTYRARPIVTPEAQANKVSGVVILRATFRADGRITDIEIVQRVDYMTDSAIEALKRSRFRPATVNGKPITLTKVPVQIKVHYSEAS
ncbi:MAG TPA: TonB family protein [Blastocatellia bacterium]|nr:TonB family protein [Blastocatellia bacterium]